jgi:RNA polymerase sigma-70 factor, ECF subfamily
MGGKGAHGLVITLTNCCVIVSHAELLHFSQQRVRRRGPHGCVLRDNKLVKEQRWSQLMGAAQEGDRAAYERLLRETIPFIRAIAARRHASEDRIDDVVQEVLLTVHRVRHTYDPARPFERWLAAITERRSIDLLRRRVRRAAVESSDQHAYETFPDAGANREGEILARDELARAIAELPPGQREAIELLKLRELSLKEAAWTSGRSIAALKVNVHRAVKALKARLERG